MSRNHSTGLAGLTRSWSRKRRRCIHRCNISKQELQLGFMQLTVKSCASANVDVALQRCVKDVRKTVLQVSIVCISPTQDDLWLLLGAAVQDAQGFGVEEDGGADGHPLPRHLLRNFILPQLLHLGKTLVWCRKSLSVSFSPAFPPHFCRQLFLGRARRYRDAPMESSTCRCRVGPLVSQGGQPRG